ncbi:hypothetical protein [Kitasatospora sp. McL0602]|uniref:hypothetical protein n=1 Tax=Kitasatospora sp. McL0602 TaxID=3439530 RepID=UPI003F8BD6DE
MVFAAFIPSPDLPIKVIGVGMGSAILIDATLVRLLLVPAVMHLLGRGNWWLPTWLDRLSHPGETPHPHDGRLAAAPGLRQHQRGKRSIPARAPPLLVGARLPGTCASLLLVLRALWTDRHGRISSFRDSP